MAQRATIVFDNQTSQDLVLVTFNLLHGQLFGPPPSQNIDPNSSATWQMGAKALTLSPEMSVTYSFQSNPSQLVTLSFDDPFLGTATATGSAPAGYSLSVSVTGGDNSVVTYTLTTL